MSQKTVLAAEFLHETSTASVLTTGISAFAKNLYKIGREEIAGYYRGTHTSLGAAFEAADKFGWNLLTPVAARATPSGLIVRSAFEEISGHIFQALDGNKIDGVLLHLHGSMVTENSDDPEGELLECLRERVGPKVPIIAVLDLHATVSELMANNANALIAYRTYPHTDYYERTHQGAELLNRAMVGEINPICRVVRGPQILGLDLGRTHGVPPDSPMIRILETADRIEASGEALVVSAQAGFPFASTWDCGPSVAVTADGNPKKAFEIAKDLMAFVTETRAYNSEKLLPIEDVIAKIRATKNPLVISDWTDNPGAGGYGDGTAMLQAMIDAQITKAIVHSIWDPKTVEAAFAAGIGQSIQINLGGKTDPRVGGKPIQALAEVIYLNPTGEYKADAVGGGVIRSHGPSATLRIGGIDVVATTHVRQTEDLNQFRSMGIDPFESDVIVVKSMQYFKHAFSQIPGVEIVRVDSGGLASLNFSREQQPKVRPGVWPLDNLPFREPIFS